MVQVTLPGGGVIIGETLTEAVLLPWSGDTTQGANDYRTRNGSKTFTYHRFRGIPYAHPPIGDKRWRPAELLTQPATSPYSATAWGNICIESDGPYASTGRPSTGLDNGPFDWPKYPTRESEDCLNLHIWTPDVAPATPLPVVVYCHDGGNTHLTATQYRMRGNRLVHKGVVYVSFEYRLSTWGFFYCSAFSGDGGVKGNYGYTDAIAALRWVQTNISAFGGDPNKVTIIGASAGGAMVQSFMATDYPVGETLFHRAFAIAGGGIGQRQLLSDAQARGDLFLQYLVKSRMACSDGRTIAQVQAQDGDAAALRLGPGPAQVMAWGNSRTVYTFPWMGTGYTTSVSTDYNPFPIKDGTICKYDTVIAAMRAGAHRTGVPFMIETTLNEAGLINNGVDLVTLNNYWASVGIDNMSEIADVVKLYAMSSAELKRQVYRDVVYGYPAYRICYELAADGETCYLNFFSYDTAGNGRIAPSHVQDLNYWLGQLEWVVAVQGTEAKMYESDFQLAEYLTQALANFAKNGNPNTAYASPYDLALYAVPPALGGFTAFNTTDKNANVIDNTGDALLPEIVNTPNHFQTRWSFFDGKLGY